MMFGYSQRSQLKNLNGPESLLFTECQNLISLKKLLQFQFKKFGRISHKFTEKNEGISIFTPKFSHPSFFAQIG